MGSSHSEAEVFVVQPMTPANGGSGGNVAGLATAASWLILSTPIVGQSDAEKSLEVARKALEAEQDHLAKDQANVEAREKERKRTRFHSRRR